MHRYGEILNYCNFDTYTGRKISTASYAEDEFLIILELSAPE